MDDAILFSEKVDQLHHSEVNVKNPKFVIFKKGCGKVGVI
jgi:hypothetical protein